MAGCCPSRDYRRIFNERFARRLTNRYRKRGLDKTARTMVEFLQAVALEGASVLEIGGGVGEVEIELLQAGAARAQNLELSPAYEEQAHRLAKQAGVQGRLDWRLHDLVEDPPDLEVQRAGGRVQARRHGRHLRGDLRVGNRTVPVVASLLFAPTVRSDPRPRKSCQ